MNMLSTLLQTSWAEALGWTLLHSLWQGIIWVALLRIGTYMLKGRPAQHRYVLTLLSVFGLAMTAVVTFIQEYQSAVGVAEGFELLSAEAKTYIWAADLGAGGTWWETMTDQINTLAPWLAGAWLLGLGMFLFRWIGAYFYVQELRYREAEPMNYHWQDRINELGRQMGINKTVLLIESRRVCGPLSLGHFKPVVLVPMGLFTGLSPVQIEAILAHELAHIRRHDYLINLMVSLLEVVFFYHPAMWYLFREVSEAREHCCDDLAVATCGSAMDYAKTLAWLAENPSPRVSLASAMGGKRQDLLYRIKRLLTPQQIPGNPGKAALALVLLLSMTTLAWLSPDLNEDSDKNFVQRVLEGPIGNQLPWFYEKPAPVEQPPSPTSLAAALPEVASGAALNWANAWDQANCVIVMPLDSPPPSLPVISPPPPPPPPMPTPPVIGADFDSEQIQEAWEAYGREMEQWGKELGTIQAEYGQRYAESMEEFAESMQEWAETEAVRQSENLGEDYIDRELELRTRRLQEAKELERIARIDELNKRELRRVQLEVELAMRALEQANAEKEVDQAEIRRAQLEIERAQKEIERVMQEAEKEVRLRDKAEHEEAIREIIEVRRQQIEIQREAEEAIREQYRLQAEEAKAHADELRREAEKIANEQRAYAEIARREARERAEEVRAEHEERRVKMRLKVEELRRELVKDGIIKNGETRLVIKSTDGSLKINGTKLKGDKYKKYRKLLKQMGVEIGKGNTISITHN